VPRSGYEYRFKPGIRKTLFVKTAEGKKSWRLATNSAGFRGPEIAMPKPPGVRRTLLLGDSYTLGWAVDGNETLAAQLRAVVRRRGAKRDEVVNLGVSGYNTVQEAALLDEEMARLEPDLVVLSYVMNDAEPQATVPASPDVTFRHAPSWMLGLVAQVASPGLRQRLPMLDGMAQHQDFDYLRGFAPESPKWRDSRDALARIAARCRSAGVPLLVAILPDFTQPFDESYPYLPIHRRVTEWAQAFGIEAVDLLPLFAGEDHRDWWIEGDGHPNGKANRRIAEALRGRVESMARARPNGRGGGATRSRATAASR
jgi:lysophospholipase L1-like esterase